MKTVTRRRWARRVGLTLLVLAAVITIAAPAIAPNSATEQFEDRSYAPPTRVRFIHDGSLRAPFIYPLVLENRLDRRYREDRSQPIPLQWFKNGRLVSVSDPRQPLLLLGADTLGRDIASRVVLGARLSLGVTLIGVAGALLLGSLVGGLAGTMGGRTDRLLMLVTDLLLAVPGAYLVLVLRGVLPQVLETHEVFLLMAALFSVAAWPHVARGVRAIVASERARDYAEAARASGAGAWRVARHLLPAANGFLVTEILLLVPALLVAEATISFVGLGFTDAAASWGAMMQDAASGTVLTEAPWMLAPSGAVFVVVLGLQLLGLGNDAVVASLGYAGDAPRHLPAHSDDV